MKTNQTRIERDAPLVEHLRTANRRLSAELAAARTHVGEVDETCRGLRASEARLRSIVAATAEIVWQADGDGLMVDLGRWSDVTGLPPSLAPEGWLGAIPPDERDAVRAAWQRAVTRREPYLHEHHLRHADGAYAWVVARGVPAGGDDLGWIGTFSDVSERRRMETWRERFAAIVAHDLRNPLSAIVATADLLSEASDVPLPHRRRVARLLTSAARMTRLIDDVLDFTRGTLAGGIQLARQPVDLASLCRASVREACAAHPARTIDLVGEREVRGDLDPDRVLQLLSNLIGNAVRHGVGAIRVALSSTPSGATIAVENHGPPIPPERLAELFEPFRSHTAGRSSGLGLGLHICCEIVRAHGGSIAATSSATDGTCFRVWLPSA